MPVLQAPCSLVSREVSACLGCALCTAVQGAEQLPISAQATEALRITSTELLQFKVMDDVIPEPLGGAHSDPMGCFPAIKDAIMDIYKNK